MGTPTRSIARNAIYASLGQVLPLLAGLIAMRILIPGLGDARFGVLTLVWAAAGYFAIFDFGLARAVTHAVAERLGNRSTGDLRETVWTALAGMLAVGIVGMLAGFALAPILAHQFVTADPLVEATPAFQLLRAESTRAFYLVALSIPFMVLTGGLRGILEAHQEFGIGTLLRIPLALTAFVGPLLVLPFTTRLEPIVAVLLGGRVLLFVLHFVVCYRRYDFLRLPRFNWSVFGPLLRFGGWTTVSNSVTPLMSQLDRFAIAGILMVDANAFYVPPFELATKLWIIPVAVTSVLFPSMTATFATDRRRTLGVIDTGFRSLSAILFPVALILIVFAPEVLTLWFGSDHAERAAACAPVLQWLAVGAFAAGVSHVFPAALQSVARPDLVAKLQVTEVPFFLAGMWWMTSRHGLTGMAIASATRMLVDAAVLHVMLPNVVSGTGQAVVRSAVRTTVLVLVLIGATLPTALPTRAVFASVALGAFALYVWGVLVPREERAILFRSLGFATEDA
jgi:O-antigen/teichoic acid export membrane protein